jgi:hypothetical protein
MAKRLFFNEGWELGYSYTFKYLKSPVLAKCVTISRYTVTAADQTHVDIFRAELPLQVNIANALTPAVV